MTPSDHRMVVAMAQQPCDGMPEWPHHHLGFLLAHDGAHWSEAVEALADVRATESVVAASIAGAVIADCCLIPTYPVSLH
jgi:hypothetical protein